MRDYKWVEETPTSQFSNRTLVLVSQFSRKLKGLTGRSLNLQDPSLAANLVREFRLSDNPELKRIFNVLLDEFHSAAELKKEPLATRRELIARGRTTLLNAERAGK